MSDKNKEEQLEKFCLLLFQSELNNLVANKDLNPEVFNSLISQDSSNVKLANGEFMDLYLCENLFSTLLPGLESLAKTSEKLIYYFENEVQDEVKRFNPCNYLAEFLMRNNPKYGKNKERVISGLKRISKPGLRVYAKADEMPRVLNGLGIAIVSTSEGLMTDKEARAKKLGGEVLAWIW